MKEVPTMSPKYGAYSVASLAFGFLIVFTPETALAQKSKARQKASARKTVPNPQITDTDLSDLPIGILQGLEDAKRYQELVRRAERTGQPPPALPYTVTTSRTVNAPPTGAGYAPSPNDSTMPNQPAVSSESYTNPYQPGVTPATALVPGSAPQSTQYLLSPMPASPNLTLGQTKSQAASPSLTDRRVQELQERIEYLERVERLQNLVDEQTLIQELFQNQNRTSSPNSHSSPTTPATAAPSQPLSMPGPAPARLPFGRRP